jgi:DNA-binding transcriptional regulator YiaG
MTSATDLLLLIEAREAARSGRGAALRTGAGISQAELADSIGVSAPCISRWEAGERRPRGAAALAYARVLHDLAGRLVAA